MQVAKMGGQVDDREVHDFRIVRPSGFVCPVPLSTSIWSLLASLLSTSSEEDCLRCVRWTKTHQADRIILETDSQTIASRVSRPRPDATELQINEQSELLEVRLSRNAC